MAAYINDPFELPDTGNSKVIMLNRWSSDDYSIQVTTGATTTIAIEGTLSQLNRGQTPVWNVLDDSSGAPLTGLASGLYNVEFVPLEAIRITVTGVNGATGRVMQQGDC